VRARSPASAVTPDTLVSFLATAANFSPLHDRTTMTDNTNLVRQLLALLSSSDQQAAEQAAPPLRPVLVTTAHRGVFFGFARDTTGSTVLLEKGRMAVRWSSAMRGVLGLASVGPDDDCRISPAAPMLDLRDVTGVAECSPGAVARWESFPWAE
jgi:hypothetical protein